MKILSFLLVLLAAWVEAGIAQTPAVRIGDNPAAGKYYDINGIKLYCEVYGSGAPLLMTHGNGGSMGAFAKNIPYFTNKYQVIAVDSRAHGKSKDTGDKLTFEMMADDFAALLDAMNIKSAYVLGWSDGGINALMMAMRHPEKVTKLVSTGANLWPSADAFAPNDKFMESGKKQYDAGINKVRTTDAEKNAWKIFLLDWEQPHISLAALHSIQCPSLIMCGDHDMISVEHTVLIYRKIPHAQLWVMPNAGHGTLRDHPEEFNQKVDEFFTKPLRDRK